MEIVNAFARVAHPIMVHFPIALILVALFLSTINIFKQQDFELTPMLISMIVLAAIGSWISVLTGFWGLELSPIGNEIRYEHMLYAIWTSGFITLSAIIFMIVRANRKKMPTWIGIFGYLALIGAAYCVCMAGYLGGYIVYNILITSP